MFLTDLAMLKTIKNVTDADDQSTTIEAQLCSVSLKLDCSTRNITNKK
jgi:hypothetical protein